MRRKSFYFLQKKAIVNTFYKRKYL